MNPSKIRWLAAIYVALILVIITLANQGNLAVAQYLRLLPLGDKLGHFFLIGLLTLVLNLAVRCHAWIRGLPTASVVVAVLITAEEFSQLTQVTRSFDWGDMSANFAGILGFSWIAIRLCRTPSPQNEKPI